MLPHRLLSGVDVHKTMAAGLPCRLWCNPSPSACLLRSTSIAVYSDTDYFPETSSQSVTGTCEPDFANRISYPEISKQILRHVSDRTGIISFANFPLIWLFGMRNNFVLWVTCWDFGTFNNFHRWIARIATLQAVIHSVGYTWLILERK